MKLLFVSFTRHQYRYFSQIAASLEAESKHIFMPNFFFHKFRFDLRFKRELELEEIFTYKLEEISRKYRNPLRRNIYRYLLYLQCDIIISVIKKAVKDRKPDFIILWNGKKFHQAIVAEIACKLGIRRAFFENGFMPDSTQMDFKGVNFSNSVPRDPDFYKNLVFKSECHLPKILLQRLQRKKADLKYSRLPEKFIFVPFQVMYDTQIVQHSPWIKDMYELYQVIDAVARKLRMNFVIKPHPSDRVETYRTMPDNSQFIFFSNESTQILIEKAEAVVTINSTVGIESLLYYKKVIVLGEAFYAIKSIVQSAESIEQLTGVLSDLDSWKIDKRLIEQFLKYLKCFYLLPGSWKQPDKNHFYEIEKRLKGVLKSD